MFVFLVLGGLCLIWSILMQIKPQWFIGRKDVKEWKKILSDDNFEIKQVEKSVLMPGTIFYVTEYKDSRYNVLVVSEPEKTPHAIIISKESDPKVIISSWQKTWSEKVAAKIIESYNNQNK